MFDVGQHAAGEHLPLSVAPAQQHRRSERRRTTVEHLAQVREHLAGLRLARLPRAQRHAARRPAGEFVLDKSDRPAVLVSAGVGITPMVSMLHALASGTSVRPTWFIHGARDGDHHPLSDEVRDLVAARDHVRSHVAYSRPTADDVDVGGYDSNGRLDGSLILALVGDTNADFYLCGPTSFMAQVRADLLAEGVDEQRIHTETFGPTG